MVSMTAQNSARDVLNGDYLAFGKAVCALPLLLQHDPLIFCLTRMNNFHPAA
jgi:hypothetical protein